MTAWRNWSGLETASPSRVEQPDGVAAVVAAVERARADRSTVKMVGTGHSFTAIAAPEAALLTPGLHDFLSSVASFVRPVPLQKTPDGRGKGSRLLWVFPQLAQQIAFMRKMLL